MAKQKINGNQQNMTPMYYGYRHNGATATLTGPAILVMTISPVDTASAYGTNTTGIYTCPRAGKYYVNFNGFVDSASPNGALWIRQNGNKGDRRVFSSGGRYEPIGACAILQCAAGDTIDIYFGDAGAALKMHGNESSQLVIMYVGE